MNSSRSNTLATEVGTAFAPFGSPFPIAVSREVQSVATQRHRGIYEFAKPAFDLIVSAFLLIMLAPLLALSALLVYLTSPGPILFRQKRVGENGVVFHMYKFRSMYTEVCADKRSPQTEADPRITPMGRFLRRSSLDELPQLINVLLGQMSLVGPRPEMPFVVKQYTEQQRRRLAVKPGITGLWQISPHRGSPIHEHIEFDLYYLAHRSFALDTAIVLRTFLAAPRGV